MDRADFTRMADRYAAYSCRSHSRSPGSPGWYRATPTRGLAVMVVATPCPLILAAPIAFVAGLSRAARAGVIVKGGGVSSSSAVPEPCCSTRRARSPSANLSSNGSCRSAAWLRKRRCASRRRSTRCPPTPSPRASYSGRRLADRARGADAVTEQPGHGIAGEVEGHRVAVGSGGWLGERTGGRAGTRGRDGRRRGRAGPDPRRRRRPVGGADRHGRPTASQVPTRCAVAPRGRHRARRSRQRDEGDRGGGGAGGRHRAGVLGADAGGEARGGAGS